MSKGKIQQYQTRTVNGQTAYWCNILRAYVSMKPHQQPRSFYPPINNGRNQLAGKAN